MPEYIHANTTEQYQIAANLFREYALWLNIDLGFQNFNAELENLKDMYAHPRGGIIIAREAGEDCGCVAIRKIDPEIAELKRMYVKPAARKMGIGHELLQRAIRMAKDLGYKKIRLDTLDSMVSAMNLYREHGFYEIPAYYFNPEKNAVFFEKEIGG